MAKNTRIRRLMGGRNWDQLVEDKEWGSDENDISVLLSDVDVVRNLATVFVIHRARMAEALERGTPNVAKDGKSLLPTPWQVVNDSLQIAAFPYEVVSPLSVGLFESYQLRLKDLRTGVEIIPELLSSGEQVILQLILWLFSSSQKNTFPRLLILDEPDAHLHPSMTVQFINVVAEVLVKKYGVRVIMSTHSPSTVALAPENSLFEMERGQADIKAVTSKDSAINSLTSGFVTVSPSSRYCFVEDTDDVAFFNMIRDLLTDTGPSKDPLAIRRSPSLVFIPASVGERAAKISGGSSIVKKWVEKLDASPLTTMFLGLIDRDVNNVSTERVRVLGRYSIENYLLDPVNIFGLLSENGTAPNLPTVNITAGDEHLIRALSEALLQTISDEICKSVKAIDFSLVDCPRVIVKYTQDTKLSLPNWLINHRGHDLLPLFQKAWGGHQVITPPRLIRSYRRVRFVPEELATLFHEFQR